MLIAALQSLEIISETRISKIISNNSLVCFWKDDVIANRDSNTILVDVTKCYQLSSCTEVKRELGTILIFPP